MIKKSWKQAFKYAHKIHERAGIWKGVKRGGV